MRPLYLQKRFLTLISMCSTSTSRNPKSSCLNACVGIAVFSILWSDLISSSFFVIQHEKRDLEDILGFLLQIAAVARSIYRMVTVYMHSEKLERFFLSIQRIYDERN